MIASIMCSFVKLYFKLDNECKCYCIGFREYDAVEYGKEHPEFVEKN